MPINFKRLPLYGGIVKGKQCTKRRPIEGQTVGLDHSVFPLLLKDLVLGLLGLFGRQLCGWNRL